MKDLFSEVLEVLSFNLKNYSTARNVYALNHNMYIWKLINVVLEKC